ncbi:MAG: heparin lyase I family protein, partial [Propylenella sp.]
MAQAGINEDFDSGEVKWEYWCPCQIDEINAPVKFMSDPAEPDTRFARIVVDDYSLGGNLRRSGRPYLECTPPQERVVAERALSAETASPQDLEPPLDTSFFGVFSESSFRALLATPEPLAEKNPYCTDDVEQRARSRHEDDECLQRQELRLRKFKPLSGDAHWYSFRIRMPDAQEIEDRKNSIRWIIAQWKEEPLSQEYTTAYGPGWGPSPFLALRFDDAVLHVTVQDEECRCLVASAAHPTKMIAGWKPDGHGGSIPVWSNGPAKMCVSSKAGDPPGTRCQAD